VNEKFEMDVVHLEKLIKKDKEEGIIPFCVVANLGTVNTGAIDPLDKIFWVCCKQNLWMHVDGAFWRIIKVIT
jgi:glutamate/tyrosine decarboxylase-like PLP-dependent enzyme